MGALPAAEAMKLVGGEEQLPQLQRHGGSAAHGAATLYVKGRRNATTRGGQSSYNRGMMLAYEVQKTWPQRVALGSSGVSRQRGQ